MRHHHVHVTSFTPASRKVHCDQDMQSYAQDDENIKTIKASMRCPEDVDRRNKEQGLNDDIGWGLNKREPI